MFAHRSTFPREPLTSPVKFNWKIANESDLRSLHGRALVTLFRSSVSSGRNSALRWPSVHMAERSQPGAYEVGKRRVHTVRPIVLCTVASFPTIKLRQVSALAACVWAAAVYSSRHSRRLPLSAAARYAFIWCVRIYTPTCTTLSERYKVLYLNFQKSPPPATKIYLNNVASRTTGVPGESRIYATILT